MSDMQVLEHPPVTTTGDDVVHLVDFSDSPDSPRITTNKAREDATLLTAVCGAEFIPNPKPKILITHENSCHECLVALVGLSHEQMLKSWWTQ